MVNIQRIVCLTI